MADREVIIYAAQNLQQAHLLKFVLAEAGIRAEVSNALLQGGSGVDIVGWPTLARVVVAEPDAVEARKIALEFDRKAVSTEDSRASAEWESPGRPDVLVAWPICPQCRARRSTRCPVCGTAGSDFPPADLEPENPLGLPIATAGQGPCCGPGGCSIPEGGDVVQDRSGDGHKTDSPPSLLCPTCDEPFAPEFPNRCEWCGHEFPDGYRTELPEPPSEPYSGGRVIAVVVAILVLAAAIAYYLVRLFSNP
jgi:hypothetical protein